MSPYKYIKQLVLASTFILFLFLSENILGSGKRQYNGEYKGKYFNHIAFPIGGIGAGMICLEGTGVISHVSVRNAPDLFYEPLIYTTLFVKGENDSIAKVIEGPVPKRKYFGSHMSGEVLGWTSYGLPRFKSATFLVRFPFGEIALEDSSVPIDVSITGWSPFIPGDVDNSSQPVGALEYRFSNPTEQELEAVFHFTRRIL